MISRSSSSAAHSWRLHGFAFRRAAEQGGQPRRRRRCRGPALERQGDLVPFGVALTQRSMSCSSDAAIAGRAPRCRACARARQPQPPAEGQRLADVAPASRCSASSSGSALISRPALSSRPRTGRGSLGTLAIGLPQCGGGGAIGGIGRQPVARILDLVIAQPVVGVDRAARIVDPEKVADAGEQARRRLRATGRIRNTAIEPRGSPDRNSSIATPPRSRARRASAWATKSSRLRRAARRSSRPELAAPREQGDELRGQGLDAARRVVADEHVAAGPAAAVGLGGGAASRSSPRIAAAIAKTRADASSTRQIVEMEQGTGRSGRGGYRARGSAPSPRRHRTVGMADQPLEHPRLAPPAARPGRGRDPLLVGAAKKQRGRGQRGRAAGARQRLDRSRLPPSFAAAPTGGQAARISSAISPTRQWSIAVISARSCSVRRCTGSRKKSTRTVGQPVAAGAARGRVAAPAAAAAIGHSSGIIRPVLSDFR